MTLSAGVRLCLLICVCASSFPIGTQASDAAASRPSGHDSETNFVFAICGDNRNGDDFYRYILKQVVKDHSSFLINTGDMVPIATAENWKHFADLMTGFSIPFFPVAGNHDSSSEDLQGFTCLTILK